MLSLKSNNLRADGGKALAEGLKGNTVITELDISSNALGIDSDYEPDMSGVIALTNIIPDMGALTTLDMLSTHIPPTLKEDIRRICTAGGIQIAM